MLQATTVEQEKLASDAGVTRGYLYQLGDSIRDASSDAAGRIAAAAEFIRKKSKNRLPKISRADLSSICAECEYAKRCLRRN